MTTYPAQPCNNYNYPHAMAFNARGSPARPSIEHLSSSVSTGFAEDDNADYGGETVRWAVSSPLGDVRPNSDSR